MTRHESEDKFRSTIRRQLAQARAGREEAEFQAKLAVVVILALLGAVVSAMLFVAAG